LFEFVIFVNLKYLRVQNNNKAICKLLDQRNSLIASFDLIKEPSKELFCFNEAFISTTLQDLQPDAEFIFSSLQRLNLQGPISNSSSMSEHDTVKTIERFKACSLKLDFVSLELRFTKRVSLE
jgi:hypothetical protein